MIPPYPLAWPEGMPRTAPASRRKSQFKTTLPGAVKNVRDSLRLFGTDSGKEVSEVVATTNVGGIDLTDKTRDPGVAVWFKWDGALRSIAVDRYAKPEENLQAIHHILEARRTEVRHGGLVIARTAFAGFKALPATVTPRHWTEVLEVSPHTPWEEIAERYSDKAKKAHPDAGGSDAAMQTLNTAYAEAKKARGVK